MGKKSRRQRGGLPKINSSPYTSTFSPERRAAAIAAAEAECRAAMAAAGPPSDNVLMTPDSHPRLFEANSALMDAVSLDEDDNANLHQYLLRQDKHPFTQEMIKVITRWPRIRKYWPRLRRRICWGCGKEYDLSEPRLWVCAGCGEARYCDEACQRAHWPEHKTPCVKKFRENVKIQYKKRRTQGESAKKIRQEFLEWYGIPLPR